MQVIDSIFYIVVLIMSIVIHEYAHGYAAYLYGDDTARFQGRLTLNPLKHLELFGSIILPLILIITKAGFVLGWAKPVPYNPDNLKGGRKANAMVAIAGILANVGIAIVFGIIIYLAPKLGITPFDPSNISPFFKITLSIVFLNLVLAFFNIIPIPPLDGSKVLFSYLPSRFYLVQSFLEQWGIFILLFFVLFLWKYMFPFIVLALGFLTGLELSSVVAFLQSL
ncbi:site-2 protease family protein [Candidatus Nomurabacteria bacterium]|nr:site-2 protease family protein [Candidatus Nomurabacteria bacterium]